MYDICMKKLPLQLALISLVGCGSPVSQQEYMRGDDVVFVSPASKTYHVEGCKSLTKSPRAEVFSAIMLKGYRPCALCLPKVAQKVAAIEFQHDLERATERTKH